MSEIDLEKYLNVAKQAAMKAGDALLKNFGGLKGEHEKEEGHFGIEEDLMADRIYAEGLRGKTPEVGIYSEESEKNLDSDLVWVIDPIEGTTNYGHGHWYWATQICLLEKREIVVAVVNVPKTGQLFWAAKGQGAWMNGTRLHVAETPLSRCLVTTETGHGLVKPEFTSMVGKIIAAVRSLRVPGATGINLAYTAAGIYDGYVGLNSDLYDYAPGVLLVREAGGLVWNMEGKDWTIDDARLLAANEKLVGQLVPQIR